MGLQNPEAVGAPNLCWDTPPHTSCPAQTAPPGPAVPTDTFLTHTKTMGCIHPGGGANAHSHGLYNHQAAQK